MRMPNFDINDPTDLDIMRAQFDMVTREEWDEYIYRETEKLVFHEYVKTTQVFNFDLFRIQL